MVNICLQGLNDCKSESSDDLETLRQQFAFAFSRQSSTRPQHQYAQQRSTVVMPTHAPQTSHARYDEPFNTTAHHVSRPVSQASIAGWVETGRYGGDEHRDVHTASGAGSQVHHGVAPGGEDDMEDLIREFKSLQERVHRSMALQSHESSHIQRTSTASDGQQQQHQHRSPNSAAGASTQGVHSSSAGSSSPHHQQQVKQHQAYGAIETLRQLPADLQLGSAAGAASLRATTTRRHLAQVYDGYEPTDLKQQIMQATSSYSGGAQTHVVGKERRSHAFGGDHKEWEPVSAMIRQQFQSGYTGGGEGPELQVRCLTGTLFLYLRAILFCEH
jgi:hypothetical protein